MSTIKALALLASGFGLGCAQIQFIADGLGGACRPNISAEVKPEFCILRVSLQCSCDGTYKIELTQEETLTPEQFTGRYLIPPPANTPFITILNINKVTRSIPEKTGRCFMPGPYFDGDLNGFSLHLPRQKYIPEAHGESAGPSDLRLYVTNDLAASALVPEFQSFSADSAASGTL